MDFFAHQDAARRASRRLLWVMALAVAAVVVAVNLVFFAAFGIGQRYEPGLFGPEGPLPSSNWDIVAWVSLGTLAVIGGGGLISWLGLRGGGRAVAESLGGRAVPQATRDADERRLMNIVEEMSIASGVPMPPVYVIDDDGINAFAAGHRPDDAAIGVTRGLLRLPRDEVQGVIAHEYSHILNGDMRLNMRLISAVAGLLAVASVGRMILDAALRAPRSSSRKKGGSPLPLIAFGAALFVIGMLGWFLGRVIQAAFSRRREFLADASAVQFTRNPAGIGGALRRIADGNSGVTAARAGDMAHLFFADAILSRMVGLFHTHPPLAERIARIEGLRVEAAERSAAGAAAAGGAAMGFAGGGRAPAARVAPAQVVELAGAVSPERLHLGAALIERLPPTLAAACREPVTARAVSLLPLLHQDASRRDEQVARIHARDPWLAAEVRRLHAPWSAMQADRARWPLLQLAAPALAALSNRQRHEHLAAARALASDDGVMALREFTVLRQLEHTIGPERAASPRTRLRDRRADCGVLLGALALATGGDAAAQQQSYAAGWARLPMPGGAPPRPDAPACGPGALAPALDNLAGLDAAGLRAVIDACAHAVAADGVVSAREAELLRLVAADLGVPIPAFPDGG